MSKEILAKVEATLEKHKNELGFADGFTAGLLTLCGCARVPLTELEHFWKKNQDETIREKDPKLAEKEKEAVKYAKGCQAGFVAAKEFEKELQNSNREHVFGALLDRFRELRDKEKNKK